MNYPAEVRFWKRIEVDGDGCWIWTGAKDGDGYGRITVDGKQWGTHQWSWFRSRGPMPEGLEPDHLCRKRACANPDCMEPVPPKVNNLRGEGPAAVNARKTHCINDHELVPPNLVARKNGRRECRTCHNAARRRYYNR